MREVKDPEVRKAEIMNAAKKLFHTKGYIHTTTQDIIKALNISRGLLYYHFKSKEDILFSIVENHIGPMLSKFESITNDDSLCPCDKVTAFVTSTIIDESSIPDEDYSLHEAIHLPENTYMVDKINHRLSYAMTKCFTQIIHQGNKAGVFNVKYPEETSAFLMTSYTFVINDAKFHENDIEKATKYLKAFKHILSQSLNSTKTLFETE